MNLLEAYFNWRPRGLNETMDSDTSPQTQTSVYDEQFADLPEAVKRYVPAAYRQIREHPEFKLLEYEDKDTFRQIVAQAATRIFQLSSTDMGTIPDIAQAVNDKTSSKVGEQQRANSMGLKEDFDVFVGSIPGPTKPSEQTVDHIRIMKTDDDTFIVRIDGKTFTGLSYAGVIAQLFAAGVEATSAMKLADEAQVNGEATHLTFYYSPADIRS